MTETAGLLEVVALEMRVLWGGRAVPVPTENALIFKAMQPLGLPSAAADSVAVSRLMSGVVMGPVLSSVH